MRIAAIIISFVLTVNLLFGQIINIPADYPTIQQGINAASEGDTVLVDSGIYYENLSWNYKSITLASHYLTTHNRDYITKTIIDGDSCNGDYGSVIAFLTGFDNNNVICGFTIQNGSGFYSGEEHHDRSDGGGIYFFGSGEPLLQNLIVQDNYAGYRGGGIFFGSGTLTDVTIRNNTAAYAGGGIFSIGGFVNFDSIELCSVYSNKALVGADINSFSQISAILDTFTVVTPTGFYTSPLKNFNLQTQNYLIEQTNANLYISPDGDDDNDGLSEQTPLKTINHAFSILKVDSLHPHNVYLLDGEYSKENNNEFPICIPDYTVLSGINKYNVILNGGNEDGRYKSVIVFEWNLHTELSNATITGGTGIDLGGMWASGGGIYCSNADPILKNLIIKENTITEHLGRGGGVFFYDSNPYLNDLSIIKNSCNNGGGGIYSHGSSLTANNLVIDSNFASIRGGGILIFQSSGTFNNTLISNNVVEREGSYCGGGGLNITSSNPIFTNTTIVNNSADSSNGGGLFCYDYSEPILVNSILWNNFPNEVYFRPIGGSNSIDVSWTDMKDGYNGIETNDNGIINWFEGNIVQDPMFAAEEVYPYSLSQDSPCIDTGTPDTIGLNLPAFDLAGNYRIWDGDYDGATRIDMGSYEFGSIPVDIEEPILKDNFDQIGLNVFPNPFYKSTVIELKFKKKRKITLSIYNQHGEKVETIFEGEKEKGRYQLTWESENLSSGIYFIKLQTDIGITTQKIIKR